MDNNELKTKYEEIKTKIEQARKENKNVSELLKVQYELLKIGFARIKRDTMGAQFDNNPKKYSTLLSYLNTMKEIAKEIPLNQNEINALEKDIFEEMKKNNLDWLLNK